MTKLVARLCALPVMALTGIDDVVVVDTPDALLTITKEDARQVKKAVESLRGSGDTDVL